MSLRLETSSFLTYYDSLWRYTWPICRYLHLSSGWRSIKRQYDLVRLMEPLLGGSASKTRYLFLGRWIPVLDLSVIDAAIR